MKIHTARDHCLAPNRVAGAPNQGGRYGRLFPDLQPLVVDEMLLFEVGRAGGLCDSDATRNCDSETAAGWPFFGQYLAHDITADRSPLRHHADATALENARRLHLGLECLYAAGPTGTPFMYDRDDSARLLLGTNDAGAPDDLMRNLQGIAIVGDPRNDVHVMMSQMHVALIKAHNGLVARLRADGTPPSELFAEASRSLRWHYHWIVAHDFLPSLIGERLAMEILRDGPRHYRPAPGDAFIPLEFADAAFRYGHSQIRHSYRLNEHTEPVPLFPDLLGFCPVPASRVIDWHLFFDAGGERTAQRAKRIDGQLPQSLIRLPHAITGDVEVREQESLAVRDLQRGSAVGLPSGEAVARKLGIEPLTPNETGLTAAGWRGETPLWFYILKEAEVCTGGDRLGAVGGRIVGEVLVGILRADPTSFLRVDPSWRPTLPARESDRYGIADLLEFATEASKATA